MKWPIDNPEKLFSDGFRSEYGIECVLGSGSYGAVYKGEQPGVNRKVAVKVLLLDKADEEAIERFRQEARLAARVTHPNVVSIYGSGLDAKLPYIVYQFIDGRNLQEHLQQEGPMSVQATIALVISIADGLKEIHEQNIVHRDLKSDNIIIDKEGKPYITDLGVAKDGWDEGVKTKTGFILGTPEYMAPEYVSAGTVTPAIDMYSLGVITYECLLGKPPFTGSLLQVADAHIKRRTPRLPKATPPALRDLVLQMLAKDPAKRPQTMAEVIIKLKAIAKRASMSDLRAKTQPNSLPKARKPLWGLYLLLAVIVSVVFHSLGTSIAEKGTNTSRPPLVSPISSSLADFSKSLAYVRQNRNKLTKDEREWLLRAVRLEIQIGQEKIRKLAPVINLLTFDEENILLRGYLAATMASRHLDEKTRNYELAKKMLAQCFAKTNSPAMIRLLKFVSFATTDNALEIDYYEGDEEARIKKVNGKHLAEALELLHYKEAVKLSVWKLCLVTIPLIRYGEHLHWDSRNTVFRPAIRLFRKKLQSLSQYDERTAFLEANLINLHLSYYWLKPPSLPHASDVLAPKELIQLNDKLIKNAHLAGSSTWFKLQRAQILISLRRHKEALRELLTIKRAYAAKENTLFVRKLVYAIVTLSTEIVRLSTTSEADKVWAMNSAIKSANELAHTLDPRGRQVLCIQLSEFHLRQKDFKEAKETLLKAVELGKMADEDLAHTAKEKIFAIDQGYNPTLDTNVLKELEKYRGFKPPKY